VAVRALGRIGYAAAARPLLATVARPEATPVQLVAYALVQLDPAADAALLGRVGAGGSRRALTAAGQRTPASSHIARSTTARASAPTSTCWRNRGHEVTTTSRPATTRRHAARPCG
jgi:hypothetical protein